MACLVRGIFLMKLNHENNIDLNIFISIWFKTDTKWIEVTNFKFCILNKILIIVLKIYHLYIYIILLLKCFTRYEKRSFTNIYFLNIEFSDNFYLLIENSSSILDAIVSLQFYEGTWICIAIGRVAEKTLML